MSNEAPYFLPYQEKWIDDESPLKIAEKSRRVGFTYASSYRMFQKCLTRENFTQWVSSRDQLTAQELIRDYIRKWARLSNLVARGMYNDNDAQVVNLDKDITAFVAYFPETKSRIVSLSSTPEAFAGKGGDVFLDEADLHRDSGALIDMAQPCTMWGGQLEIVSAYRVDGTKDTPFAKMVASARKDNPQQASLHRVTIHDAVAQGLVEKINAASGRSQTRDEFIRAIRAKCRTVSAWESQYECKVQDAGGRLIPLTMLAPCQMKAEEIAEIERRFPDAPRFAGFDIARHQHASAWHEYIKLGVTLYLVRREVWHDRDFATQWKFVDAQMERRERRISRLALDATGLGMEGAETRARKFPGRVDQVNLESHRRTEMCMAYQDKFRTVHMIVPDDADLQEDITRPYTATATNGALRVIVPQFENPETEEISHCDEFMAGVLGTSAAESGASEPAAEATSQIDDEYTEGRGRSRRSFM